MNSNFAPWQAKGRWYRVVMNSDGTKLIRNDEKSDLAVTNEYLTYVYTPADFKLIRSVITKITTNVTTYQQGAEGISRANRKMFTRLIPTSLLSDTSLEVEMWIFGYFENAPITLNESEG